MFTRRGWSSKTHPLLTIMIGGDGVRFTEGPFCVDRSDKSGVCATAILVDNTSQACSSPSGAVCNVRMLWMTFVS